MRIGIKAGDDRPYEDTLFTDRDYCAIFETSGSSLVADHRPLRHADDLHEWLAELTTAPWVIYELSKAAAEP